MSRLHFPHDRGETVSFTVTQPGRDDKGYRRALQVQTQGTRIVGHDLNVTVGASPTKNWEVIYNKIVLTFWYEHIGGGVEMGGQIVYDQAKGSGQDLTKVDSWD